MNILTSILADLSIAGSGYHQAEVIATHPEKLVSWAKFTVIFPVLYLAAVLFPKLAILGIYLRIFTKALYRIACWVLAAILVTSWFANMLAALLMCIPLEYSWDKSINGGHCFDVYSYYR